MSRLPTPDELLRVQSILRDLMPEEITQEGEEALEPIVSRPFVTETSSSEEIEDYSEPYAPIDIEFDDEDDDLVINVDAVEELAFEEVDENEIQYEYRDTTTYVLNWWKDPHYVHNTVLTACPHFELFVAELDSYYGNNYDLILKTQDAPFRHACEDRHTALVLIIYMPEVTLTNSNDLSHTITDFFVQIRFSSGLFVISNLGDRASASEGEINKGYRHSHLSGGLSARNNFTNFCMGDGVIADIMKTFRLSSHVVETPLDFKMRCSAYLMAINNYVAYESLEGGPYNRFSNINTQSLSTHNPSIVTLKIRALYESGLRRQYATFYEYAVPKLKFTYTGNKYSIDNIDSIIESFIDLCNTEELPETTMDLIRPILLTKNDSLSDKINTLEGQSRVKIKFIFRTKNVRVRVKYTEGSSAVRYLGVHSMFKQNFITIIETVLNETIQFKQSFQAENTIEPQLRGYVKDDSLL